MVAYIMSQVKPCSRRGSDYSTDYVHVAAPRHACRSIYICIYVYMCGRGLTPVVCIHMAGAAPQHACIRICTTHIHRGVGGRSDRSGSRAIYTYVYTYTCMLGWPPRLLHTYTYIYIHIHACRGTYIYASAICTYINIYKHIYTYIYAYICMPGWAPGHIYIHTYINKRLHMYVLRQHLHVCLEASPTYMYVLRHHLHTCLS